MTVLTRYQRPATLQDALELLSQEGSLVLAGGTGVNAGQRPAAGLLVDLQALGLDGVHVADDGALVIGATTRLGDLATTDAAPMWLRELARKELPSTLRTLATVGGTVVAGCWESALVAGLLACDAVVSMAGREGTSEVALVALLSDPGLVNGRVITAVRLDIAGNASVHSTARTIADRPIVACIARHTATGVRVAMSGVADTAVVVDDVENLSPPGDFRGSSEYRRHLARVLRTRALTEIGADK
ncbi:MAG TPA: FAD binding domain-containing protein [Ilumatobacteraceae bacterium]|nr:FAD binding domain-containing protein [Ilumatobacteraceae bacterium]HRB03504.1 FAD binding domain-containing protein [Ilumatobacteraceae bacterium]